MSQKLRLANIARDAAPSLDPPPSTAHDESDVIFEATPRSVHSRPATGASNTAVGRGRAAMVSGEKPGPIDDAKVLAERAQALAQLGNWPAFGLALFECANALRQSDTPTAEVLDLIREPVQGALRIRALTSTNAQLFVARRALARATTAGNLINALTGCGDLIQAACPSARSRPEDAAARFLSASESYYDNFDTTSPMHAAVLLAAQEAKIPGARALSYLRLLITYADYYEGRFGSAPRCGRFRDHIEHAGSRSPAPGDALEPKSYPPAVFSGAGPRARLRLEQPLEIDVDAVFAAREKRSAGPPAAEDLAANAENQGHPAPSGARKSPADLRAEFQNDRRALPAVGILARMVAAIAVEQWVDDHRGKSKLTHRMAEYESQQAYAAAETTLFGESVNGNDFRAYGKARDGLIKSLVEQASKPRIRSAFKKTARQWERQIRPRLDARYRDAVPLAWFSVL